MTELSPAAQAARSAYHEICEDYIETWLNFNHNRGLAAALRAAITAVGSEEMFHPTSKRTEGVQWCVQRIYAIADELEAQ